MPSFSNARLSLPAFAFIFGTSPASAQTYANFTLTPAADTFVDARVPGQNYGSNTETEVNAFATGDSRGLYRFDFTPVPTGSRIVSATLRFWVTNSLWETISVYRLTAAWSEAGATWTNASGLTYNGTALGSFMPNSSGRFYDIAITSAAQQWFYGTATNHGVLLIQPTGNNNAPARFTTKEWATVAQRSQLALVTLPPPAITDVRSSTVLSDPFNGTAGNQKRIPGAVLTHSVRWENRSSGYTDANIVSMTETVPSGSSLFVGDIGATGSGPVLFTQGTPTSGTTYTYSGLASTADDISFSSDSGTTFNYTPVPDASGFDSAVTHYKVAPKGAFAGEAGSGYPSFTLTMRTKIR